jgi:DNA-directed RNA polymerase specialized sigma24 family protein
MSDRAEFLPTRWSLIAALQSENTPQARQALDIFCRDYWYPLYAYVRRLGHTPEDAADLTQGFFAFLMEKDVLTRADPARGRLRTFLLTSLQNYIRGEWRRQQRQCRGGGRVPLVIDTCSAEQWYTQEPADTATPELLYQRRWALNLLERTLSGLQSDYEQSGKGQVFAILKPTLTGDPDAASAALNGEQLGMTAGAVRVAICRLRTRYRKRLVAEVAASLEAGTAAEVDEEIDALFRAVS